MCGIFGGINISQLQFQQLYRYNAERGPSAYGAFFTDGGIYQIHRSEKYEPLALQKRFGTFIGHCRASTTGDSTFSYYNSHPVQEGPWVVFHNGIISNVNFWKKELQYIGYNDQQMLDSRVFPYLFCMEPDQDEDNNPIIRGLNKLSVTSPATFGLAIFNLETSELFICRSGCSLWYRKSYFSSEKPNDLWCMLPEHQLFKVTEHGVDFVKSFNGRSPYYVPR